VARGAEISSADMVKALVAIEGRPWAERGKNGKRGKHCGLASSGIISKRKGSAYRFGRSPDWLKMKNPACSAVKREAEEDWGR
jgi:hypothetical protein